MSSNRKDTQCDVPQIPQVHEIIVSLRTFTVVVIVVVDILPKLPRRFNAGHFLVGVYVLPITWCKYLLIVKNTQCDIPWSPQVHAMVVSLRVFAVVVIVVVDALPKLPRRFNTGYFLVGVYVLPITQCKYLLMVENTQCDIPWSPQVHEVKVSLRTFAVVVVVDDD